MRSLDNDLYKLQTPSAGDADWGDDIFPYFHVTPEAADAVVCKIEGLNVGEGVKNAGGKTSQYAELLRLFVVETSVLAGNLVRYYECNGNMFRIKLHGMKNSCNCIGAAELGNTAKEIEAKCLEKTDVTADLNDYSKQLMDLVEKIKEYLEEVKAACAEKDGTDNRQVCMIPGIPRDKAAELHDAMQNLEFETVKELMEQVRKRKYSDEIELCLDRIVDLCNCYDFNDAMELLTKVTEPI